MKIGGSWCGWESPAHAQGNVMLLALALYSGMFDAIESPYLHLFRWVSMGISLLSLAWPGRVFFTGAWSALRTRTVHLDLPIAIGLGAGAIWGVVSTIRGTGEIYFDSLSVLVFALLLGRFMQTRQQRWAADSIELLYSLTPTSARIVSDAWADAANDVPIEAVQPGMIAEVLAGDSIPVDGVIVRRLIEDRSEPAHWRIAACRCARRHGRGSGCGESRRGHSRARRGHR